MTSLNVKKTKHSFFHKTSKKDNIPLRLPRIKVNGLTVERESSRKFQEVWIEKNLTWRNITFHFAVIVTLGNNFLSHLVIIFCHTL